MKFLSKKGLAEEIGQPKYQLPVMYKGLSSQKRREVREQYVREQKGLCWHCKGDLDKPSLFKHKLVKPYIYPPGFFDHPIHLHHDKKSGLTLGAVHAHCNAVLFEYHGE